VLPPQEEPDLSHQNAAATVTARESNLTPGYAWVILAVTYIASVAAVLNQMKVSALIPLLQTAFRVNLGAAGLLMSVFAVTGTVLSLPSGVVVQRLGLKAAGMTAMSCVVAGCIVGALSPSFVVLLCSRSLEGIGFALIAVVAPTSIAMWFPRAKVGTPMGIWSTWAPLGTALSLAVAPPLARAMGWRAVWWSGGAFAAACLLLLAVFLRARQSPDEAQAPAAARAEKGPGIAAALKNRHIWLLTITMTSFSFGLGATFTFLPTYFARVRGFTLERASLMTSVPMIVLMIVSPLAGIALGRIGRHKLALSISILLMGVMVLLPFRIAATWIPVWAVLIGIILAFIPTVCFSVAPAVMGKPELASYGLAALILGQNLGVLIGPTYFGAAVDKAGWVGGSWFLVPWMLAGFAAAVLAKIPKITAS
jgi:predicted MFS family arabinose efflux permease